MWESNPESTAQSTVSHVSSDPVLRIFCGALHARLHITLFECPGIHRPCIEFAGEMLTPHEFCYRAAKDKHKDWKSSIRSGRYSLRHMMESQALDFHNHADVCSGRCVSRNGSLKSHKPRPRIPVPTYQPYQMVSTFQTPYSMPPLHLPSTFLPLQNPPSTPSLMANAVASEQLVADRNSEMRTTMPPVSPPPARVVAAKRRRAAAPQEEDQLKLWAPNKKKNDGCLSDEARALMCNLDMDPMAFWADVKKKNMLPDILKRIDKETEKICSDGCTDENVDNLAPILSRLTHALNLKQKFTSRLREAQIALSAPPAKKNAEDIPPSMGSQPIELTELAPVGAKMESQGESSATNPEKTGYSDQ